MKKQAEGKRIFDVAHHGFIMRKCKGTSFACMLPAVNLTIMLDIAYILHIHSVTLCMMLRPLDNASHYVRIMTHSTLGFDYFGSHSHYIHVTMFGATGRLPMLPGNGVPVALENDEQTPAEAEQALTEALTVRIASLDAQLAKLGILGQ